ncbi:hypothetical protein J7F01_20365 [Streptomyces sp. ISL-22]|uniref:DUF6891 domain-containing protein n=1 Tax=unclassified Streptomyces TaxID=2593676 RepID=UPI001BEB9A7F|nr:MULTISPECIES: hypothetical protein [unclassified Streptomyces]MBT2423951.1 hypothetical protein [Streptomyces sp. ISL-24]MBT2434485.1 hypothetical protein [Streptomyces sp. ISL-22]
MEIDGGHLDIKVETENWQTHARIPAARLRELVARIGGAGDRFLVVQRIPDIPDVFAQVWHEEDGDYRLEHRLGEDGFYGTNLAAAGQVADLMTGWARQDAGWDAGVVWEPIDLGPRDEVPELPDAVREKVEGRVRARLRCGYDSRRTLVEIAQDFLVDGDERPVSRAQAWRLVDRLWLERLTEQEAWEGVTDPERLTGAFRALEAGGITARENFACCRGCGMAEIGAEREGARGFVFFHQQVTEQAAEGYGLSLYYGGFDGSEETTADVGHEVVAALRAVGLSAQWDGSPEKAITITPLTWHRRLEG